MSELEEHCWTFQEKMQAAAHYIHCRVRYRLASRQPKNTNEQDLGRAKPQAKKA